MELIMKKTIAILLVLAGLTTAVFAQDSSSWFSLGGGGLVNGNFLNWKADPNLPGNLDRYNTDNFNVGPYIFIDMKYFELNFGILYGSLNKDSTLSKNTAHTSAVQFGGYFKVPITLSSMFTLFPLLGADYDLYFLAKDEDKRDAKFPVSTGKQDSRPIEALSTVCFKAGAGLDTFFTDNLFMRTELLYGIRLPNKTEKYLKDQRSDVDWMLCHGGTFKIAIGYRF